MDLQFEIAVGQAADGYGVVEVARRFAVDGYDGERTEIAPAIKFYGGYDGGNVLGFIESGRRKVMGQVKLADGDFNIDAEVVGAAENLDDASVRTARGRGPVGNFDVDDYAFEIVPALTASGFDAQDAVSGERLLRWPRRRLQHRGGA